MNRRENFRSITDYDCPDAVNSKIIKALLNQPVTLYKVSPLYRASFDYDTLEDLAARLEEKLIKLSNVDANTVRIEPIEGFPFSYPAIEICVTSSNKYLYHGILFSVDEAESRPTEYTSLPFLAVVKKSNKQTYDVVHKLIRERFVCNISPLELTESQVQWIGAIAINETVRRKFNTGVTFVHSIASVKGAVKHNLSSEYLSNVWAECLFNRDAVLNFEKIDEFFHGIWLHAKRVYGVDLKFYPITKLSAMGCLLHFQKPLRMKVEQETVLYILLTFISDSIRSHCPYT